MILFNSNKLLFKYAHSIKDTFSKLSFKNFLKKVTSNTNLIDIDDFIDWVDTIDKTLDVKKEELLKDWTYLENQICAEIASHYWGKNYYYYILLLEDMQLKGAIENISLN